jgi:TolB-like protein
MFNRIRTYSVLMVFLFAFAALRAAETQSLTIAIANFKNNTGMYSYTILEQTIPELLKTELSGYKNITVVERSKIESVLEEQALGQTGIIEEDQVQKVGMLIGAQFVITGEISRVDERLRLDAHVTHVETGEVFGEKVTGPDKEAVEVMIRVLANNIANNLTGEGRRIRESRVKNYRSYYFLGAGVLAGTAAIIFHADYKDNYDTYHQASRLDEFNGPYERANKNYKARNATALIAVAALTTGITLWLKSKSEANVILAQNQGRVNFALSPVYNPLNKMMGIQLCLSR